MGVYLPIKDYSAMQGPAPDGFHIPLSSEWQGLKTIMDGLSLTTSGDWRINLHLPLAGRLNTSASTNNQGVYAYYWSSSPYSSAYPYLASSLLLWSSISTNSNGSRAEGRSVRCFNNSFITPTSSWTVITGTLGGAGIFRNQTEGLISITSDGTTGYTIQDKNLGATTVYNDGDTLSEANCGKYYQWGNNYGFLRTGDVTTSSTQVNASAYGPGNYYSSSTFITGSTDRSSVHNDNLWGGVTGVKPMSDLKNAYIGEYRVPGENTIAYYPFKGDAENKVDTSQTATITDGTVSSDYVSLNFGKIILPLTQTLATTDAFTASIWFNLQAYRPSGQTYYNSRIYGDDSRFRMIVQTYYEPQHLTLNWNTDERNNSYTAKTELNSWTNIIVTYSGSGNTIYLYKNGVKYTYPNGFDTNNSVSSFEIGHTENPDGYFADFILENVQWTDQEVADYYNQTKGNYGL